MCLMHGCDVCLVFLQPAVRVALVRSALRPAPVPATSYVTDTQETVCVKVKKMTANKVWIQTDSPMNIGAYTLTFILF